MGYLNSSPFGMQRLTTLKKEANMSEIGFVSDNQREQNLSDYLKRLEDVKSGAALLSLGKIVMDEQKRTNNFFFPKGGSKVFWDKYRELKTQYADKALEEIEGLLKQCNTVRDIKRLKSNIYSCNLFPYEPTKQDLFQKCDKKIARIEAKAS